MPGIVKHDNLSRFKSVSNVVEAVTKSEKQVIHGSMPNITQVQNSLGDSSVKTKEQPVTGTVKSVIKKPDSHTTSQTSAGYQPVPAFIKDHSATRQFSELTRALDELVQAEKAIKADLNTTATSQGVIASTTEFFARWFGLQKNHISDTLLREEVEAYTIKTNALHTEVGKLNTISRNIHYSAVEVKKQLTATENAVNAWQQALHAVINLTGPEDAGPNIRINALQSACKYQHTIEPLLTKIGQHTGELNRVREQIANYKARLPVQYTPNIPYQNTPDKYDDYSQESKLLNNDNVLWLHDLHTQIGYKHRQIAPSASELSQALKSLVAQAVVFPSAHDAVILLETFFPLPEQTAVRINDFFSGQDPRRTTALMAAQQKKLTPVSPEIFEPYEQKDDYFWPKVLTEQQRRELEAKDVQAIETWTKKEKEYSNQLHYLKILYGANNDEQMLSLLRQEIATLQKQRQEHPAYTDQLSALMSLPIYHEIRVRSSKDPVAAEDDKLRFGQSAVAGSSTIVNQQLMRQLEIHNQKHQLSFNDNWVHDLLSPFAERSTGEQALVKLCQQQRNALKEQDNALEMATISKIQAAAFDENNVPPKVPFFELMERRADLLKKYEIVLTDLIRAPSSQTQQHLVAHLKIELKQVQNEIALLEVLLGSTAKLKSLDNQLSLLLRALAKQSELTAELDQEINIQQRKEAVNLAQTNQAFYQSRAGIVQENIDKTRELCQKLAQKAVPDEQALVGFYRNTLNNIPGIDQLTLEQQLQKLLNGPLKYADPLVKYNTWQHEQNAYRKEVEVLKKNFQLELLFLRKEEERAKKYGGYPEDIDLATLIKNKFTPRTSTHAFLLSHQLALKGKTLADAYQDLYKNVLSPAMGQIAIMGVPFTRAFKDIPDIESAAKSLYKEMLGIKPDVLKKETNEFSAELKKLIEWTIHYPEQAEQLLGDLSHFYDSMMRMSFGMGSDIKNMIQGILDKATLEQQIHGLLSGSYENIAGITPNAPTLPEELIAFLHLSALLPYLWGSVSAMTDYSLSGRIASIGLWGASWLSPTTHMLTELPGAGLLVKAMFGVAQASVENDLVKKLRENQKELETVRAVMLLLNQNNTHTSAFKAFMSFYTRVEFEKTAGTLLRDATEGHSTRLGKTGTIIKRQTQRIKYRITGASTERKAAMVATGAGITTAAVGTGIAVTVATGGALPVVIGVGVSIIAVPAILDRILPKKLHNEYIIKMTNKRIDEAIARLLDDSVDKKIREEVTEKLNELKSDVNQTIKQAKKVTKSAAKELIKEHVKKFMTETLSRLSDMERNHVEHFVQQALNDGLSETVAADAARIIVKNQTNTSKS